MALLLILQTRLKIISTTEVMASYLMKERVKSSKVALSPSLHVFAYSHSIRWSFRETQGVTLARRWFKEPLSRMKETAPNSSSGQTFGIGKATCKVKKRRKSLWPVKKSKRLTL